MLRRRPLALPVVASLALLAVACGGGDDDIGRDTTAPTTATETPGAPDDTTTAAVAGEAIVFPGTEWETGDPADHGVSQEGLDELATYLEGTGSNCMTVVKDGVIVDERYWNGTDATTEQEIFSASKSYTSTLVGIAADLGFLDIDQPASDFITEWQGTDSETVTIRNLLSNDSGRYYDFETDYVRMAGAENRTEFAIALDQQHPPGEHWEYNNSAIQTLQAVLERSTGQDMTAFAEEHLFGPTGMSSHFATDRSGTEAAFMGVQASCRDMARFGYLFLNEGQWGGEQIVSAEYVGEATSSSQDLNRSYGFLWWLNNEGWILPAVNLTGDTLYWPETPDDAYAAIGLGDQIVLVLPSQGLVVTRTGPAPGSLDRPVSNTSIDDVGRLAAAAAAEG